MYLVSAETFSGEVRKNLHLLFRPVNKSLHIPLCRRRIRRRENAISNTPTTNVLNFVKSGRGQYQKQDAYEGYRGFSRESLTITRILPPY